MICNPNCPENWVISRAEHAALATVLFSHSPMPVDTWLTDVPEAEFRSTQQPTASDGLGEDVEL